MMKSIQNNRSDLCIWPPSLFTLETLLLTFCHGKFHDSDVEKRWLCFAMWEKKRGKLGKCEGMRRCVFHWRQWGQ